MTAELWAWRLEMLRRLPAIPVVLTSYRFPTTSCVSTSQMMTDPSTLPVTQQPSPMTTEHFGDTVSRWMGSFTDIEISSFVFPPTMNVKKYDVSVAGKKSSMANRRLSPASELVSVSGLSFGDMALKPISFKLVLFISP